MHQTYPRERPLAGDQQGWDEEKNGAPTEDGDAPARPPMSQRKKTVLLVAGALVALALVIILGAYQFGHRAQGPIDLVKALRVSGTDVTIGSSILDFVKERGIKVVSEGFRPTWGAEQVSDRKWVVSYIFEVGREARWASWRVDTVTGGIEPANELARQIQNGTR